MELVHEGFHNAVAVRVEGEDGSHIARFGEASNGTKQVLVYFEILDGDAAGQRLPWFGYFTEGSWKRTIESLRYCGFKGDDLATLDEQELDQRVSIQVEHEERETENGTRVLARIAWVNRVGGSTIKLKKPMDANDLRKFAASMNRYVSGVKEVEGEKASAARRSPAKTNGSNGHTNPQPKEDAFGDGNWGPPPAADSFDDIPF